MKTGELTQFKLPGSPGVYFFKKGKETLYIGKATSLADRVKSYFNKDLIHSRGGRIVQMVELADMIEFQATDSVLEALILEAALIKKHQPFYNVKEKDDKSWSYVGITKEDFPQVRLIRGKDLVDGTFDPDELSDTFGPFTKGMELRAALKIIRRIFPYRDERCVPAKDQKGSPKPCFNHQIGLCPGVCTGEISKVEYRKVIRSIRLLFQGKKQQLIRDLERHMKRLAKEQRFEEAAEFKHKIFALQHIQDVALIKNNAIGENLTTANAYRIEAYDIAHLSGRDTVGVMVVVEDEIAAKSDYRKFKIKGKAVNKVNDIENLKEVIRRRLSHPEWRWPQLIVVDGNIAQINAAREVLKERGFNIEVVAVTKDEHHRAHEIVGEKGIIINHERGILYANSEAHRFSIAYHRTLRSRSRGL